MVKLALLWHMHQPYYEDLATGEHVLPWVRLHALKDYWGMVALLREFPGVSVTFNLVPSLLVQIEAFAADRADDRHLRIGLKAAESLERDEREFLVAHGFHAPFDRMIRPFARYAELHARRAQRASFDAAALRDLQVLHKLVWMDPDWMATDSRLTGLVARGRDFTENDKAVLRKVELEILNAVIPAYREAAASARVELSTSPFYHPILPLLCDTDVHLRAHPESALPRALFSHPEDAALQLSRAFEYHASLFGSRPQGVWPSEGSVSDDVIRLLAAVGCEWTASDEDILSRSLHRPARADDLYSPHDVGESGASIRMLFRDHRLSDLIGFAYQSWDAEAAAADFVQKVSDAGHRFAGQGDAVVTVILDGENAWEHYPGGGRPFLRALYRRLETSNIETLTMSNAAGRPARRLRGIFPGSWINADFYIWAGHRDDHRAWRQLAAARQALDGAGAAVGPDERRRAHEELLIAEGSDWFWWYGDDHSSDHDREFDELFRRHLRNAYRALKQPVPDELHATNITTGSAMVGLTRFPTLVNSRSTGKGFDVARWMLAVDIPLGAGGGTMHRVAGSMVQGLRVAADSDTLYLHLEGPELAHRIAAAEVTLTVLVDRPQHRRVPLTAVSGPRGLEGQSITTAAAPFSAFGVQAGERFSASVLVTDAAGQVLEQHPEDHPFEVEVPTSQHDGVHWVV